MTVRPSRVLVAAGLPVLIVWGVSSPTAEAERWARRAPTEPQARPAVGSPPAAAARPASSLVARVRENLVSDDLLPERYRFRLTRRTYEVSALGKVSNGPERLYEVVPSPVDPARTWRRLVAVDGQPLTGEEQRARDDRHRRDLSKRQRERERAEEQEKDRERLDDVFRVFDIQVAGEEVVDGRRLLAVTLTPRRDAETRTREGEHMKKLRGRAWVHEPDAQLARLDVEFIEDVTVGWGVIGRVHKGSRATYRRAPLPDGTWVPVEARFAGTGRTLLFRPFDIETWAFYTDYQRLSATDPASARTHARP
jgi:hypothetical protein